MRARNAHIVIFWAIVDQVLSKLENGTEQSVKKISGTDDTNKFDTIAGLRRKADRSTSSSSGEKTKSKDKDDNGESLELTESSSSTDDVIRTKPKLLVERRGWRKWHRQCTPCPEDMIKKWRDPSINWICGGYQRARRSFKSLCIMHYRNCQDGTMFTKLYDHRCKDDDPNDKTPHGDHFLYDYKVRLSEESSMTKDSGETSSIDLSNY